MTNYLSTVRGTIATATLKEIFVFTVAGVATADAPTSATAVMNAFKTAWTGASTIANQTHSGCVFTEVTTAEIINLSTGTLKAASHVPFSPTLTGSSSAALPSQCAVCVSTAGGSKPNGIPYRGRFYLPSPAQASLNTANGLLSDKSSWANFSKAFILACIANSYVPAVWSRKDANMNLITQVRVGDRVDTIRTRRNELAEVYTTLTIP